ncbi:hypothetical protein EDD21DRAFT_406094 [Dissophora ornata]|nr:hypothetical protein BGZ58_008582 [Dissophora ornata]KAI8599359.1 hypothetical protein EDD21DRAFT_406094 [Dissophora ornata]
MFESVGVTFDMSARRAWAIRVSTLIAFVAITYYNYISTCSPYYSTTYLPDCANTLIPAGTELMYPLFKMQTLVQIDDYDGFEPQECVFGDVIIQEWLASVAVPAIKLQMVMNCTNGISLAVGDITYQYWNENYVYIAGNASYFQNIQVFGPGFPFDAVEFKFNCTNSDGDSRLFHGNETIQVLPSDTRLDRSFFTHMMSLSQTDVQSRPLPNVKYLCSKCAAGADWKGQSYALAWQFAYNTFNTVVSVYALIAFFWTMSLASDLADLMEKVEKEKAAKGDPEEEAMVDCKF